MQGTYIPAQHFEGKKLGYFFTKGAHGLGYYMDAAQAVGCTCVGTIPSNHQIEPADCNDIEMVKCPGWRQLPRCVWPANSHNKILGGISIYRFVQYCAQTVRP